MLNDRPPYEGWIGAVAVEVDAGQQLGVTPARPPFACMRKQKICRIRGAITP
ncbi:hypothetical protein JK364_51625 [Streptomyces sp. 110]|uniref:Uncharacterized protein n=1 Tax=Streptomyces endocoffeicus TaxID=2898945 RepID=A0ABS1Q7K6_9ACTN|nr:hypothetical protein [Streptomyces endocoffeicus]MBL1120658.1 hypothetical protein [Streptomyces endocoffeicus]